MFWMSSGWSMYLCYPFFQLISPERFAGFAMVRFADDQPVATQRSLTIFSNGKGAV
jgi:hypothetical protein